MDTDRATVLVVDDTPENIDLLVEILKEDYKVQAAPSGEQGLKIASLPRAPDIIMLDVMMPDIDGYEVCRRLKLNPATQEIPIIFVTAKMTTEDEIRGFSLGAVDYITKPISPPVVLARVRAQLALHNQARELARQVRKKTQTINETRLKIIQRLGRAAEYKDDNTGMHVIRMSYYAQILGRAVGMNDDLADMLLNAAPMHDIGKIGIPDRILQKSTPLDDEEWTIMKTHTEIGPKIIGQDDSALLQMACEVAHSHHEAWDGTGYPEGRQGEDIPLAARIVTIADVFDALTSTRPYKTAWPVDRSITYIKEQAGKQFDPTLVTLFVDRLPEVLEVMQRFKDSP